MMLHKHTRNKIGLTIIAVCAVLLPIAAQGALVSYWDFEGGSGVEKQDKSGNGHTLTFWGNATTGVDTGRTALLLDGVITDGVGDYASTPAGTGSDLDMGYSDFTVSLWMLWDLPAQRAEIISHLGSVENTKRGGYYIDSRNTSSYDGRVILDYAGTDAVPTPTPASAGAINANGSTFYSTTAWQHYAFVVKGNNQPGGTLKTYLNGVEAGTADISTGLGGSVNVMEANILFTIGSQITNPTYLMGGSLDDVAVWRNAATAAEIADLYSGADTPLTSPIPEPSTITLLIISGLSLVLLRRLRG